MFYQIFLSPQVKRYAIISNKHGIYVLPQELSNDLKQEISKYQENLKVSWKDSLPLSLPAKLKVLLILAKKPWETEIKLFP